MRTILIISLSVIAFTLASCSTVRGVGNGVQSVGNGIVKDLRKLTNF